MMLTNPAIGSASPLAAPSARAHTDLTMRGCSSVVTTALLLSSCAVLLAPQSVLADDLKLKDGSKVSGTIVGFEENSFKVKTSYGFAIVQKDQVVSISMSATDTTSGASTEKLAPVDEAPPAGAGKNDSAKTAAPAQPAPAARPAKVATKTPAPSPSSPSSKSMDSASAPASNAALIAPAPPANAAPPKPLAPEPIREAVNGNVYTNETYRFHMYKPPDWDLIAAAPAVLPGAITAMGTGDDMTYFLIGQEPAGKSLATNMDTTEKRLRDVMGNFRALDEKQITVSGTAVTEHRFRGSVDQHDWSGVVVIVPRGSTLFTIFGMTRADNDLVQIQENVIARAISSLQFTN
jgi:hypothetical protein